MQRSTSIHQAWRRGPGAESRVPWASILAPPGVVSLEDLPRFPGSPLSLLASLSRRKTSPGLQVLTLPRLLPGPVPSPPGAQLGFFESQRQPTDLIWKGLSPLPGV